MFASRLVSKICTRSVVNATKFRGMATIKFTSSHEYIQVNGNIGTVGISQHAADALGDVVFVDLPSVGKELSAGDSFGSVESVKAASDVYSPVAGEVVEVNSDLESTPGKVNESPLEGGWFMKIKIANLADIDGLMDEAIYKKHVESS